MNRSYPVNRQLFSTLVRLRLAIHARPWLEIERRSTARLDHRQNGRTDRGRQIGPRGNDRDQIGRYPWRYPIIGNRVFSCHFAALVPTHNPLVPGSSPGGPTLREARNRKHQ